MSAFTFPPSLDTWNQPWYACQMVSISLPVRCIRATPRRISVLIVCQSPTVKCKGFTQVSPLFFLSLSAIVPWQNFHPKCLQCLHRQNPSHSHLLEASVGDDRNCLCSFILHERMSDRTPAGIKLSCDVFVAYCSFSLSIMG